MLFGRPQSNMPSRFLKEIPESLLENHSVANDKRYNLRQNLLLNVDLVNEQRQRKTSIVI